MKIIKTSAKNLRPGDKVVVGVERILGVQGRKPRNGQAPLMRLEYEDGTVQSLREDEKVSVLR